MIVKSQGLQWTGNVARIVGNQFAESPLEIPRTNGRITLIRILHRKIGCEDQEWMELAQIISNSGLWC
jgi:hypothetical protein